MSKHMNLGEKQLAIQLHVRGFKNIFIAKHLNRHRNQISFLINEWRNGRFATNRKTRNVLKLKLSAQQVFKVLNYFIKNPFSTYIECIRQLKLPVHRTTIMRVLTKNGIRNYIACSKQFLSMQNQIKRLKFAIKYQHWTTEWLKVNFLDEKTVQTFSNGRVLVKRKVNERYSVDKMITQEIQNTNNKVNLVGLVSFDGPNMLYAVSTNLNGKKFEHLMKNKVKDIVADSTVIMDNASIHTLGIKYLENYGVRVLDFPPKSNDLNIIENVWAELQKILNRKLRSITISTKIELLSLIEESWKEVPVSYIKNCILSMQKRLKEVIKMRGKQTKY